MQRSFLPKNHDLIRNRGETEEENEKEQEDQRGVGGIKRRNKTTN